MNRFDEDYAALLRRALRHGDERMDRTGVGTRALFGESITAYLDDGFPLTTLRKLNFKNVIAEALWYLRGEEHLDFLHAAGVRIWDSWAMKATTGGKAWVGPVYGVQWRHWSKTELNGDLAEIDQVATVIEMLKANPYSRRMVVSAWNPADLDDMALPPCPFAWQLMVHGGKVNMLVYQRSADLVVGLPHDVAVHALLLVMICEVAGMVPGKVKFAICDAHLYRNHEDAAHEMSRRAPRESPRLMKRDAFKFRRDIDAFELNDYLLDGYMPHPAIRVGVAV